MLYADAKRITELTMVLEGTELYNLDGIQDFINLKSLFIYGGTVYNLDLDFNTSMTDLRLKGVIIENHLFLPLKSNLRNVFVEYGELNYLNLRENENLDSLTAYSSNLE